MVSEVVQDASMNRFELVVDGASVGEADYQIRDNTIVFTHTEIDPSRRGSGFGGALIQGSLNLVRAETEYRVVASCPFVADWIDAHPDYRELLTR